MNGTIKDGALSRCARSDSTGIEVQQRLRVYYDGGCPVCSREIAFYRSRKGAGALAWVDVHGADAAAMGPSLSRQQALARMHVRLPDGTLLSGAAAFGAIWSSLPGLRWLGRLLSVPLLLRVAEIAYRLFLIVRRYWRPGIGCTFS